MITNESFRSSKICLDFDKILIFKKCWSKYKQRHKTLLAPTALFLELSKEMGFICPPRFNFLKYHVVWCQKILSEYFKISHSINKIDLLAIKQSLVNKTPLITYEVDTQIKSLFHFTPFPVEIIKIISEYADPNIHLNYSFNQIIYKYVNCKMPQRNWDSFIFNVNKLNSIFTNILQRMDFYLPINESELDPDSNILSQFFKIRCFFKSIFCDAELSYKILHYFYIDGEKINDKIWIENEHKFNYIKILNFFIEPLISNLTDNKFVTLIQQILCYKTELFLDFNSHKLTLDVNGLGLLNLTFLPLRKFTSNLLIEYLSDLYFNNNEKSYHWENFRRIEIPFRDRRGLYELFLVKITEDLSSNELKYILIKSHRELQNKLKEKSLSNDHNGKNYKFSSVIDTLLLYLTNQIVALDLANDFEFVAIKNSYQFKIEKILNVLSDLATFEKNHEYLENHLFKRNFINTDWQDQINRVKERYYQKKFKKKRITT